MRFIEILFKNIFSGFLRRRHVKHNFSRPVSLEILGSGGSQRKTIEPSKINANAMLKIARFDAKKAIALMSSNERGLTNVQAKQLQAKFGLNETEYEKPISRWKHLWYCYSNPFNVLLSVLAAISYLTDDIEATAVIGTMVVLSTIIRFIQEGRSNLAAEKLKAMVSNTATVFRRNENEDQQLQGDPLSKQNRVELPIRELVPGDIVFLSAGDMVPADCLLLTSKDLFVSQAAMTGESLPVEKNASCKDHKASVFDMENLVFMGTNVISGYATALVVATGNSSYFGSLALKVAGRQHETSAFESGVNSVTWLLIRFALVMIPVVLLINGFTKGDWLEALLFALSVAVGLTPEMLPMIVTSTLAKGAVVMSSRKVIVKRLDAIQNFGAMDVLCTDKTGTITQDKIALERHTDAFGSPSEHVLRDAYLNSYFQTGLKNLLDQAVLEHVELQQELKVTGLNKIDEIPFDFERRRLSVILESRDGSHELICKGAVEEILSVCNWVQYEQDDEIQELALTPEILQQVRGVTQQLNQQGLRVVAVARKKLASRKSEYGILDEEDLVLVGYIAFLDPPKESAAPAIRALSEHGVQVKVLTGDSELITSHVCSRVGLENEKILLGADIEKMSDKELAEAVEACQIFARLTPNHKERIVRVLRSNGHVVGFMGDGINDAPGLRSSDIGISVDSGVDIAKEAADIILLEKSLMVLEQGVIEGRKTFCNMLKYIRMTASSNFGNVFSVLVGSAFLPFLPMLPLQLLIQNLLYDISQIAIPFDNVDQEMVRQPLQWNPTDIGRFMVFFGPISSIFDILTYGLMWFVFSANTVDQQSLFQTGWFVVGLLTQTLIVHMIRSPKLPFVESRASWPLMVMTIIIMTIGVFLPVSPLAEYFGFQELPMDYYPWLAGILFSYAALTTSMKKIYIRKFGWQ